MRVHVCVRVRVSVRVRVLACVRVRMPVPAPVPVRVLQCTLVQPSPCKTGIPGRKLDLARLLRVCPCVCVCVWVVGSKIKRIGN